jgi:tetratricopeptide (TPR) repeat protein
MFRDYLKILLTLIVVFIVFALAYFLYWKSCVDKASDLYASGKMYEAEKMLLNNIEVFPAVFFKKNDAFLKLGEIYYHRGEIQKAEQHYHQALNINSDLALPLFRLGIIRDGEGRLSDAIDYFERALKAKMENPKMVLSIEQRLAAVLYRYGSQYQVYSDIDTAHKCFKRILEIYPDFPEAVHAMGSILANQKKLDQAWSLYKKAPEMNPDLAILYKDVSDLLIKRGKPKEAKLYRDRYDALIKEMVTSGEQEILKDDTN